MPQQASIVGRPISLSVPMATHFSALTKNPRFVRWILPCRHSPFRIGVAWSALSARWWVLVESFPTWDQDAPAAVKDCSRCFATEMAPIPTKRGADRSEKFTRSPVATADRDPRWSAQTDAPADVVSAKTRVQVLYPLRRVAPRKGDIREEYTAPQQLMKDGWGGEIECQHKGRDSRGVWGRVTGTQPQTKFNEAYRCSCYSIRTTVPVRPFGTRGIPSDADC